MSVQALTLGYLVPVIDVHCISLSQVVNSAKQNEVVWNNTTSQKANIIISYVDLYSQTLKRIDKGYRIWNK